MDNPMHLGDGLYAEYDGYHVVLKANDFHNPTDKVYLEPRVLEAFMIWLKGLKLI